MAWYAPVSQVRAPVALEMVWFIARVYVWAFAEQEARILIAVGVAEREV